MREGIATHASTGLEFVLLPQGPHDDREPMAKLQREGFAVTGVVRLPRDLPDLREGDIPPSDANARGSTHWAVMVRLDAHDCVGERLAAVHGPFEAQVRLRAICREAGERWLFRARLERSWRDGRRAS